MRAYIKFGLGWMLATQAAAALVIEGRTAFTAAEVEVAAFAGGALDAAGVERLYLRAGYLDVVCTVEGSAAEPRLVIAEGPPYRLGKVDARNDTPLDHATFKRYIGAETGGVPSPPVLHNGLTSLLADLAGRGYLQARAGYALADAGPGRVNLTIWAKAGRRFAVGDVTFAGADPADEQALGAALETKPGKPPSERALAADLLATIDYYRERGYPRADARPHRFELVDKYGDVNFTIVVTRGTRVVVKRVDITGNRRTRDAVIRREMTFTPGDPYDLARLRESARRVYNLKYFEAEPTFELTDEEKGVLALRVAEKRTYHVAGGLAYQPAQGETSASLIGDADLALANLAGTGRELRGNYRRFAATQMDAGLSYYEPFIGGVDLFALPKGDYRERPDYRKLQSELSVGTHPLLNLTAAGGGGYDRVWGDDASRKVKALAWTEYDGRDHFTNPRRGGWAYVRAEVGVKRFDADGFVTRVPKLEIDGWFFLPTARAQTLGFRLAGAAVSSKRATADEYFPLGGRKNLRGFREEHFLTDRYALATVEYRFLTSGESRVFVFADGAYHRRGEPRLIEGAEGAYGAGFRARTPVGLYGVDYGLAVGVGPLAGMLHVTIEEDF